MPEIVQEIGAAAGLAAVLGLAVLSALYFSQARDVKRLREWAGRAPERSESAAPAVPGRVVAQPQAPQKTPQGPPPVPVPRPAAAAASGAAPATAQQSKPAGVPVPATAAAAAAQQGGKPDDATTKFGTPTLPGQPGQEDDAKPAGAGEKPAAPAEAAPAGQQGAKTGASPASPLPGQQDAKAKDGGQPADGGPAKPAGQAAAAQASATPAASPASAPPSPAPTGPAPTGSAPTGSAPPGSGTAGSAPPSGPRPSTPAGPPPVAPPPVRRGAAAQRPAARPGASRAAPQETVIIPRGRPAPWYRRIGTRYVAVLLAGLVVLGGAAAYGVTQLTGDDGGDTSSAASGAKTKDGTGKSDGKGAAIDPGSVTVAVLNGTTVPGLAATLSDQVSAAGFKVGTITNFSDQQLAESVVQYAPGHQAEAKAVSRRVGIPQREPVNPSSRALAGDATVIVIAGADKSP